MLEGGWAQQVRGVDTSCVQCLLCTVVQLRNIFKYNFDSALAGIYMWLAPPVELVQVLT